MKDSISFKLSEEFSVIYNTSSRPEICILEITTRCNLACKHCFRNVLRDNLNRDMDDTTLEVVLDELTKLKVRRVTLTGFGEPLLHQRVDHIITKLSNSGIRVVLNTNGTLVEEHLDVILNHVFELALSLEYPSYLRDGEVSKLLRVLEYIRDYKAKTYRSTPILTAYIVLTKYNLYRLGELVRLLSRLGFTYVKISNLIPVDSYALHASCMLSRDIESGFTEALDNLGKRSLEGALGVEICPTHPAPFRRCPYVSSRALYIAVDGAIAPCMYYSHNICTCIEGIRREIKRVTFGSVKEGLLEVWSRPDYVKFRLSVISNMFPSCFSCRLRWYCPLTLSNLEDCIGNSPTCAHCPFLHGMTICPI